MIGAIIGLALVENVLKPVDNRQRREKEGRVNQTPRAARTIGEERRGRQYK